MIYLLSRLFIKLQGTYHTLYVIFVDGGSRIRIDSLKHIMEL